VDLVILQLNGRAAIAQQFDVPQQVSRVTTSVHGGRRKRKARRAILFFGIVFAATFGACGSDNHPVIVIENNLPDPVTVVFVNTDGQESSLVEAISPGFQYSVDVFSTDKCTPGVLVARDTTTGAEVARSQSPVCRPSHWVIGIPGGS
jgi:hypothetical protein